MPVLSCNSLWRCNRAFLRNRNSILFIKSLTMQRHITKIFDIHFLLLFEQFYITKKIRRIIPDFLDFLYFVCEQGLKTPLVTPSCNIAITPSQATPLAIHGRA